jgi:drug/metabolite transporter (DMT)-like permease
VRGTGFFGDLLALAGAVTVAAYLIIGRAVRGGMPLLVYILLTYGSAALTLVAGVFLLRGSFSGFELAEFTASLLGGGLGWGLCVLLLALVPQLIGHSSYNWALKYLPATFVSVTVLGEPIGSVLLAYLLLGETPTPLKLFGAALILGGILLAARRDS